MLSWLSKIPNHRKGLIYISFTAFLWSTSGFFIKYLTINAFQISFYRSLIAALTVLFITFIRKQKLKFEFDRVSNFAAIFYAGILILFQGQAFFHSLFTMRQMPNGLPAFNSSSPRITATGIPWALANAICTPNPLFPVPK